MLVKEISSVVPSIDTGVCDQQTRKFNSEASKEEGLCIQSQQTYHSHKKMVRFSRFRQCHYIK